MPLVAVRFRDSGAVGHIDNGSCVGQDRAEMCRRGIGADHDYQAADRQHVGGVVRRDVIMDTSHHGCVTDQPRPSF